MLGQFSFKDFEKVHLKATYNMEIGDRTFEPGETIAVFDKVQIAGLTELNEHVSANGGYGNRAWVFWDTVKEQQLIFSQGVFSGIQFSLLANSRAFDIGKDIPMCITRTHEFESNENGQIKINETPFHNLYIYDKDTGKRITEFTVDGDTINLGAAYKSYVVNYLYDYSNGASVYKLGQHYLNGFVRLEGITRVKDDTTGQVVTGILVIPHLKLMSDLSIRLGAQANPVVANFAAVAVPVGSRGRTYVSEFYILGDDIDSDL